MLCFKNFHNLINGLINPIIQTSTLTMPDKTRSSQNRKQPKHPVFLIDDSSLNQSTPSQCPGCQQYQQDISILQQKLMQTHNKLIEQIDICREQEIKIIKLSANSIGSYSQGVENNKNNTNVKNNLGKLVKKNDQQYMHSLQPLIEARTELLRNDLQVMRAKVLSEIQKSNKLKQQNKNIEAKHEKEIQQFKQRIKKIQSNRSKLIDENQKLIQELQATHKQAITDKHKTNGKCMCGFEKKYYQLDKAFMNQRVITNQLIQQNNKLQNRIQMIHEKKAQSAFEEQASPFKRNQQIRTEPKRKKTQHNKQKFKQQFQATRNLIKKLEEAENQIRSKHFQRN